MCLGCWFYFLQHPVQNQQLDWLWVFPKGHSIPFQFYLKCLIFFFLSFFVPFIFKDELMRHPSCYAISDGEREMRKKSSKLILEKKLAILERAIENNPNEVDLKLARLKLCIEFWEPSAVVKEWQKLIFLHPNNPALWQKYLLFCQSQFSTFTVSKTHGCYGKCLSTLSAVNDGSMVSHPALPGTEEAMLGKRASELL